MSSSSTEQLQFKGYAIKSTEGENWHSFDVIDFTPKRFEDNDVEVKIHYCGICSSDVHTITAGWGEPSVMPLISGHEIAGEVNRVGKNVTEFKKGDRVVVGAQVSLFNSVIFQYGMMNE